MDVRSIVDVEPEVEHNGTVPVWYLVKPREMHDLTDGGSLELVQRVPRWRPAARCTHPSTRPTSSTS